MPPQHRLPVTAELLSEPPRIEFSTAPPQLGHSGMLYQQPIVEGAPSDFFNLSGSANLSSSTLHHSLFEDWSSFTTTIVYGSFQISGAWDPALQGHNHVPNPGQSQDTGHNAGTR